MDKATRDKARGKVHAAIKKGILTRPSSCSKCGSPDKKLRDGRTAIQAHHEDYSKPLDVEWLCVRCHVEITPFSKCPGAPVYGVQNGASKLNSRLVRKIMQSKLSGPKTAVIFGVHSSTVYNVWNKKYWIAASEKSGG